MVPTAVHVGVMDSARPGKVVTLPVEVLSQGARALRGLGRFGLVAVVGIAVAVVPLIHLCGIAVVCASPVVGFLGWKGAALIGTGEFECPKCNQRIEVPPKLTGWPARVHCKQCGAMVELRLA